MSKNITATVSDELFARLEPHRDQINISRLLTRALEDELKRLEAMSAIEQITAKHRGEAKQQVIDGQRDALRLAELISYEKLDRVCRDYAEWLEVPRGLFIDRETEQVPPELLDEEGALNLSDGHIVAEARREVLRYCMEGETNKIAGRAAHASKKYQDAFFETLERIHQAT